MATIVVLGDGSWGTAIALHLARDSSHRVRLWSARPENGRRLRESRVNERFLPGVRIPDSVLLTECEKEATDGADWWVTAIPTVHLRPTLARFVGVPSRAPVVSLTKGIELETFRRPTEIIAEMLNCETAVLSGPSHAEEVTQRMPCSLVAASDDSTIARSVQKLFHSERFRVYTNSDVIGVEVAGALKNVIGIAAGACDGLNFGDNAKSALLTRGLVEMARFGVALGAEHATFHGLAGIGDLITTCISPHGRNRRVGVRLGRGESLEMILRDSPMIAEGVTTCKSVHDRTDAMGVEMPITTAVYEVIYRGKSPLEVVNDLMTRQLRRE